MRRAPKVNRQAPPPARTQAAGPITGSGQTLYGRARDLIPGGTQLLSKRPEMFLPEQWPAYYAKAKGAEVWDLDGKRYLDFTHCGVGACILGYADPDVNAAVTATVQAGNMATLNSPEEVDLAELLVELHPWAEMVRYARTGGEVLAIAVRIARAATGRDHIAFCGYHGWHDWYLAANIADGGNLTGHLLPGLEPAGVPAALGRTVTPFRYNRLDELQRIVEAKGSELAAIVMEPRRDKEPEPGFLTEVRRIAEACGAALIFDEVTSGWRMTTGGVHLTYGVNPHLAVFAKAMSNGYPMAAVIGVRDVMQAAQKSFISSTYWTERIGPAAALATIHKHRREGVADHLIETGSRIGAGWQAAAAAAGLRLALHGIPPLIHFHLDHDDSVALETLFVQEMLFRGFLASNQVYAMFAHRQEHVDSYLAAAGDVFEVLAQAVAAGDVHERLHGPVRHTGFRRLN